jgi:hypothetical protein
MIDLFDELDGREIGLGNYLSPMVLLKPVMNFIYKHGMQ